MGDISSVEIPMGINWGDRLEQYFASTGEKAHCLSWAHKRAEALYSYRRTWIDLPSIIGSGLIAFLNAGSGSIFAGDMGSSSVALGVGSLCVGILHTLGSYFSWAKRAEGHRISAIHYAKLHRFLAVELSLPRDERTTPGLLLKYVRDHYDRLSETSPMIPPEIIREFQRKFSNEYDISKPEEANGLEKITIYVESGLEKGQPLSRQRTAEASPSRFMGRTSLMLRAAKTTADLSRDPKTATEILSPAPAPLTKADLEENTVTLPTAVPSS